MQRIKSTAGISALLTFAMLAGVFCFFKPMYDTNDDSAMRIIISGWLPGAAPSSFSVFMHPYYTGILAALYSWMPTISWYDLAFFLLLGSASFTFFYVLQGQEKSKLNIAVMVVLAASIISVFFVQLQYTLVASFLAVAALLVAYASLIEERKRSKSVIAVVIFGILLAAMVRWESMVLIMAFGLVASIPLWVSVSRKRAALHMGIIVAGIMAAYVLRLLHGAYYTNHEGWQDVLSWVAVFHSLIEYNPMFAMLPKEKVVAAFATTTGWSANDIAMIHSWFFSSPIFDYVHLSTANQQLQGAASLAREVWFENIGLEKLVGRYYSQQYTYLWLLMLLALGTRNVFSVLYAFAMNVAVIALCIMVEYYTKPAPFRLWFALIPLCAGLILLSARKYPQYMRVSKLPQWIFILPLLAFSVVVSWDHWKENQQRRAWHRSVVSDVKELLRFQQEHQAHFVIWGPAFPMELWLMPFHEIAPEDRPYFAIMTGMMDQTPTIQQRLRDQHIESLEKSLCEDPQLYLIADSPNEPEMLRRYTLEHFPQSGTKSITRLLKLRSFQLYQCSAEK